MKIMFIGDITGKPGRKAIKEQLDKLRRQEQLDFVIANGENAAGGNGITGEIALEFYQQGIDVITLGNHAWDKREIMNYIAGDARMLRPANYPAGAPGAGFGVYSCRGKSIGVISLCGRVFMGDLDCPFRKADELVKSLSTKTDIILVDIHAEATSEKIALGCYLDGRVSAVVGTHTHVQTADAHLLPKGTAYITDIGMTGPQDSVLGIKPELVISKFISQLPQRFEVASTKFQLNSVIVEIDDQTHKPSSIRCFNIYE